MAVRFSGFSSRKCPYCPGQSSVESGSGGPSSGVLVRRHGRYRRRSDGRWVGRFLCSSCQRSFSSASFSAERGQKKRQLNEPIRRLLMSGVSQRQITRLLHVDLKTVARKLVFLARRAECRHERWLSRLEAQSVRMQHVQFDEMESSIHTKCLPVSIPLLVQSKSRWILGIDVCSMPAKGLLAQISRRRYGPRADHRAQAADRVLARCVAVIDPQATLTSDLNPHYPLWIRKPFPHIQHRTTKGRRGCVVGQGELKRGGFDPLFSLNHTAAMIRAHVNRMFRRTWCTSKRMDRLRAHLILYVEHHNRRLGAEYN